MSESLKMEYKEIPYLSRVDTYKMAIDANDFDSMCLRLVSQLSRAQIEEKLEAARSQLFGGQS